MKQVCILIYTFLNIDGYDYKISTCTLKFEPSIEITSQQQCLEIEIINDSLPEDWEVFTLLLSTKNLAVKLAKHKVDMYISTNDIDGNYHTLTIVCVILVVAWARVPGYVGIVMMYSLRAVGSRDYIITVLTYPV